MQITLNTTEKELFGIVLDQVFDRYQSRGARDDFPVMVTPDNIKDIEKIIIETASSSEDEEHKLNQIAIDEHFYFTDCMLLESLKNKIIAE